LFLNKNRRYRDTVATITLPDGTIKTKWLPSLKEAGQMLLTFALAVFGWIIFRAENISDISLYLSGICDLNSLVVLPIKKKLLLKCICFILFMLGVEWINRINDHGFIITIKQKWIRWIIYICMLIALVLGAAVEQSQFIYFQF
ncbi:MAG: MBOAT family protein, partial [Paludibacteraceae bacterium]|nr:MBOAT family protein [Paludibacteraceae bacterium]